MRYPLCRQEQPHQSFLQVQAKNLNLLVPDFILLNFRNFTFQFQTRSVAAPSPGQRSVGRVTPPIYTCAWDGYGKVFNNVSEFGSHLLSNVAGAGHISPKTVGCTVIVEPLNKGHIESSVH